MASAAYYIGMDLGGSTFKALAVTSQGTVLGRTRGETPVDAEPAEVVQQMVDAIRHLRKEADASQHYLAAVGFGVQGILGGGVAGAFDLFGETLHRTMRQRSFREVYESLRIVKA
jgi:sugar (pentulose or hexulose) kinase